MATSLLVAQTKPPTPRQDLERVAIATALDRKGMPPWHLRMSFDLYDLRGARKESGTIEEWWASASNDRVVIESPSYHLDTSKRASDSAVYNRTSYLEDLLLRQVVHPIQKFGDLDKMQVLREQTKLGGVKLSCLEVVMPGFTPEPMILGKGVQMCVEPDTNILRVQFDSGQFTDLRNRLATFANTSVALDNTLSFAGKVAITGHVDALESYHPPATDEASSSEPPKETIAGIVLAGAVIRKQTPDYPEYAKEHHISGSVVIAAIISKEGKISSVDVVSSPHDVLSSAAVAAVKQWAYKPYLLNGLPTEVETEITVNFNLNSY